MSRLVRQVRPLHWLKNVLVFAPLFFSFSFNGSAIAHALLAFVSFCFTASAVYALNDIIDVDRDRVHPTKKKRPLAAGLYTKRQVWALFVALLVFAAIPLAFVPVGTAAAMAAYLAINVGYSYGLKTMPIVDVMILSFGFVLRVVVGALAIGVFVSHWIVLCTFFLALFLALGKRKNEMAVLSVADHSHHRRSSSEYTDAFMDQILVLSAGITLVMYVLYTIDKDTITRFGGDELVYTSPIVVYVLFRYLFLLYNKGKGGDPVSVLTGDRSIMAAAALWALSLVAIYLVHFA